MFPYPIRLESQELLTGSMHTINFPEEKQVDKNTQLVQEIKTWVDKEYEDGRVTVLTDSELVAKIESVCSERNIIL